ncbi:hypothetical protein B9Z19DRAFT_268182 [Tuber borchii]|uniref:Uncharacterized protein n=1 Tax=Tuber borchii TaxID=42251 RepID=A0A2T6ZL43_TUBBO|nr:hypothetical protein B9Z19DRAFT_268182 [Tuber borchii]
MNPPDSRTRSYYGSLALPNAGGEKLRHINARYSNRKTPKTLAPAVFTLERSRCTLMTQASERPSSPQ